MIRPIRYQVAISYINDEKYDKAIKILSQIGDYRDSHWYKDQALIKRQLDNLDGIFVGTRVEFGVYELDNNEKNGNENLTWTVVAVENGKALLLCEQVVACKKFNNSGDCTWADSSIRAWLNNSFYDDAFNKSLKNRIVDTYHMNTERWYIDRVENNCTYWCSEENGYGTEDRVFLISLDEIFKYKENYGWFYGYNYPSYNGIEEEAELGWMTRSTGSYGNICVVEREEGISYVNCKQERAVCPAIWITIE